MGRALSLVAPPFRRSAHRSIGRDDHSTAGQAPDDLTCPEDLPGEVDASIRCELTSEGEKLGVTITATKVEGSTVDFDVAVDE